MGGTIIPAVIIIFSCFVIPESPRWLVTKGRDEEAVTVLESIYPLDYNVDLIVRDIGDTLDKEYEAEHAYGWDVILFPTPAFRRMLFLGIAVLLRNKRLVLMRYNTFSFLLLTKLGLTNSEVNML